MPKPNVASKAAAVAERFVETIDDWAETRHPQMLASYYDENRATFSAARRTASEIVVLKATEVVVPKTIAESLEAAMEATVELRQVCEGKLRAPEYPEARRLFEIAVGRFVVHGGNWAAMRGFVAFNEDAPVAAIEAARKARKECREHAEQTKTILADARKEAKDLFIREGAGLFAGEFENYAKEQKTASKSWLRWAVWLFALTVLAAGFLLLPGALGIESLLAWLRNGSDGNGSEGLAARNFGQLTGRIAIVTLLTYATTWCARMSQVLRHAATVNQHRANSAKALLAFRKGTADAETKNRILTEATKAVFQNIQTGYLGKVEGPPGAALLGRQN